MESDGEDSQPEEPESAFMAKDRKSKTIFVGNVPLDASAKQLKKLFS